MNQKELVMFYNKELTEYIKEEPANAEIIIDYFLAAHEKERKKVYFPTDFTWKEQEKLIYQYIESDSVNPNYLGLLENAQSSSEFPVTDKMRLEAKRRNVEYCNKLFSDNSGIFYETEVIFKKIDEPEMDCELDGRTSRFIYSRNWIKNNLDYNTLLNNFIHLFGYTDLSMRCSFASIPSKLGIFERSLGIKGKKYYPIGTFFNIRNIQTSLQMSGYINELKENGIQLEDVFKWFFETYLDEEFGVKDFRYNTPSPNTTSLEKCKLIASEIDGVLKQYNLYCEDGKIDRELFEMSSKHVIFSDVKSLNDKKYAYSNSNELEVEQSCSAFPTGNRLRIYVQFFCNLFLSQAFCKTEFLEIVAENIVHHFHLFKFFLEASVVIISRKNRFDKVLFCEQTLNFCVVDASVFLSLRRGFYIPFVPFPSSQKKQIFSVLS